MNIFRLAMAFAAGAAAMYYFDPVTGRRRRALVRDQGVAAGHDLGDFAEAKTKRAADRMRGTIAEARARMSDEPISDERLHARIRSQLGRLVDEPGAIKVDVYDGNVVLSGRASAGEIDALVDEIAGMQGVESVENRLGTGRQGGRGQAPGARASH